MNNNLKTIEIEYRSIFDKKEHERLKKFLDENAKYLGPDDKDVHFFIFPDKLLKVTNNISKKNAKISLKLNRIGKGSAFEEIEFPIPQGEVDRAAKMFTKLEVADSIMHSFQKRNNYLYKGVELALKFSPEWQHHLELEIVVDDEGQRQEAEDKIREVAKELGVHIMTEEELSEFVKRVEEEHKRKISASDKK